MQEKNTIELSLIFHSTKGYNGNISEILPLVKIFF